MSKEIVEIDYYESPDGLRYYSHDANKRFILRPIQGWGMADIAYKTEKGATAKKARAVDFEALPRTLVWDHLYEGCSRCEFWDNQYQIVDLLRPDRVSAECFIVPGKLVKRLPDGKEYYVNALLKRGPRLDQVDEESVHDIHEELQFICYDAYVYARDESVSALAPLQSILNTHSMLVREDCLWNNAGGGVVNGAAQGIITSVVDFNGDTYVGGVFDTAGGAPVSQNIAVYDKTGTWVSLAAGVTGRVQSIAVRSDGVVFVATQGGLGTGVMFYDPNIGVPVWGTLDTGVNGTANVVTLAQNETKLYVGGQFTTSGPFALATPKISAYNFTTSLWEALGAGVTISGVLGVLSIVEGFNGLLAVGGTFTQVNGAITVENFAVWIPFTSTWSDFDGLTDAGVTTVDAGVFDDSGNFYGAGNFDTAGGIAAEHVAVFNAQRWLPVAGGLNNRVLRLKKYRAEIHASGLFTASGSYTFPNRGSALFNGSVWHNSPFALPFSTDENLDIEITDQRLVVGGEWGLVHTTATGASCTQITANCNRESFAIVTFTGPGKLYTLANETLGYIIYFDLELVSGEIAVLDMSREPHVDTFGRMTEAITFISNIRGSLIGRIRPGSRQSSFAIAPGDNRISLFAESTVTASLSYRCRFWSMAACEEDFEISDACISVVKEASFDNGATWVTQSATWTLNIFPVIGNLSVWYRITVTNCGSENLINVEVDDFSLGFSRSIGGLLSGNSQVYVFPGDTELSASIPRYNGTYKNTVSVTAQRNVGYFVGDSDTFTLYVCEPTFPGPNPC